MKKLLILAAMLALTGCATYKDYSDASVKIAQFSAEEAKANAALAEKAGPMAQGFYFGSLAARAGSGGAQQLAPPRSPIADLLQFAGIVLPVAVQGYGIRQQTQLGIRQSDNGARQSIAAAEYGFKGLSSTNAAFEAIAGKIQASGAVTTTTTTTSSANQANQSNVANQANQQNPIDRHDTAPVISAPVAQ